MNLFFRLKQFFTLYFVKFNRLFKLIKVSSKKAFSEKKCLPFSKKKLLLRSLENETSQASFNKSGLRGSTFVRDHIKGKYLDSNQKLPEPQSSTLPIELYLPISCYIRKNRKIKDGIVVISTVFLKKL